MISGLDDLVSKLERLAGEGEAIGQAALGAGISVLSKAAARALPNDHKPSHGKPRKPNPAHAGIARQKLETALSSAMGSATRAMTATAKKRLAKFTES